MGIDHRRRQVLLQCDGIEVQYVAALGTATGDTLWTKPREVTSDLATLPRQQGLSERDIELITDYVPLVYSASESEILSWPGTTAVRRYNLALERLKSL